MAKHMIESLEGRRLLSGNLVANGSFESPQIGLGASGQAYTDYTTGQTLGANWKVVAGSADIVSNAKGGTFSTIAAAGNQTVDLNGFVPGTISQNITTVVGHRYLVRFAYTATPFAGGGAPTVRAMDVQFGGKKIASLSKSITGETPAKPGWTYAQYVLVATSTTSAITFVSRSAGSLGMLLDDVSVVEQPFGTASFSGQVFADGNGDGKKGIDAIGLGGWSVWIDLNGNGTLDLTDLTATTDRFGNFTVSNLPAGKFVVHVVPQTGWKTTTPPAITITLTAGKSTGGLLFGEQPI